MVGARVCAVREVAHVCAWRQVPLLNNAVVAACGGVISGFAELQRSHVRAQCVAALQGKLEGASVTVCVMSMCTFMANSERAIEYMEQLRNRIEQVRRLLTLPPAFPARLQILPPPLLPGWPRDGGGRARAERAVPARGQG